jgi:K+-transporting ATPase ATPase A chain
LQRLQVWLPLNPAGMAAVSPDSAFNTAISFVSNTNWQGYAGESTMSYLTQMLALSVQNFLLRRHRHRGGVRAVPRFCREGDRCDRQLLGGRHAHHGLAAAAAVAGVRDLPVGQGVIQNFDGYKEVATLETTPTSCPKTARRPGAER